jgi:hypothetical protein
MLQGRGEGQRVMNPWKTPHLNHKGGISDQESGSASRTWTSGIRISFCYSRVVVFFSLLITDFAFSLTPFPKGHTAARSVPPLFRPLSSVLRSKAGECRKLGQSVLLVFPKHFPSTEGSVSYSGISQPWRAHVPLVGCREPADQPSEIARLIECPVCLDPLLALVSSSV